MANSPPPPPLPPCWWSSPSCQYGYLPSACCTTDPDMSAISIDNVHKHYGAVSVLQGIDLHIEQGSVLALLGPSGCGKTTLLRLIAGFDPVDQGQIAFGEVEIGRASCRERVWCARV